MLSIFQTSHSFSYSSQYQGGVSPSADGEPVFSENEEGNGETVRLIHKGAMDFCEDYINSFAKYPYMLNISGSDAYAPFLSAVEDNNRYFGAVLKGRTFNFGVGTEGEKLGNTNPF